MTSRNERLLKAAYEGKVDEIAALLDRGAGIDFAPPRARSTPLMEAIRGKHEAAAFYLIECGANIALAGSRWDTALHSACRSGLEAVARELLKRGADVKAKGGRERRPLHVAADFGRESIVRLLVTEHGAQVNARDEDGATPLLLALVKGHEGVASFLLSAGADASISTTAGLNALHHACRSGLTRLAGRLLDEFGLDLHAKTKQDQSCLHLAAFNGHVKTCKLLLERGIFVDEFDEDGQSPLACAWSDTRVAELLLDHGADIEHQDNDGYTPLCSAIAEWDATSAILLFERGARLDVPLPDDFPDASIDEGLTEVLEDGFLKALFTEPDTPIPPYRRTLRWVLTSPAVAALVQKNGWSLLGTAKTDDEVEEMIKKRLGLIEDDAWKRRMHLVIDRALDWGYGDKSKVPGAKKPRLDEKKEEGDGGQAANAGAGKANE